MVGGELERAVLDELRIKSSVGSVVDVLEEDAIHGLLYGAAKLVGLYVYRDVVLSSTWQASHQGGKAHCYDSDLHCSLSVFFI